ncbi:MAG: hypothetical protein WAK57_03790 [Desulfobacterales bacterium]
MNREKRWTRGYRRPADIYRSLHAAPDGLLTIDTATLRVMAIRRCRSSVPGLVVRCRGK